MSQTSPVTEIAEGMEALREIEVAWLSRELGRAISNLAYPVGCGAAPADYHLDAAAKALFERYAKMIEMARTAGLAQTPAVSRDKIAALIQSMCAEHVYFDSQEYELMGVGKMSYAVADKLLADSSTDRPAQPSEVELAFLNLCEALGLQATPLAYMDAVAARSAILSSVTSTDRAKDDDIQALNEEIERMRAAISSRIREAGK